MKIEPKIAIACRDEVEIEVALQILEKAGIRWPSGNKATEWSWINELDECRLYINPSDEYVSFVHVCYNEDPDDFEYDDEDDFEWTYTEASEMFKNQIISERRKHAI